MQDTENDELSFSDVELPDALEVAESMIKLLSNLAAIDTAGKAVILHLAKEVVRLRKV